MKKYAAFIIICVLLAAVLAGCTARNNSVTKSSTTTAAATQTTAAAQTAAAKDKNIQSGSMAYFKTTDWQEFTPDTYKGKSQVDYKITLPDGWALQGTVINDADGEKRGEIVGMVILGDNSEPFDAIEIGKSYGDNTYTKKGNCTLNGNYCYTLTGTGMTEKGEWNIYSYAVVYDSRALLINYYSFPKLESVPKAYTDMIASLTLK